ncbi:PAS domain S-box protein [Almyronema epifaneia]|uniref:histidine kinase n=1 Tax=Almyronema epifaneia S1 TaxID=2991925 RepID=A0ABW6IAY7_9CYAN
MSSENQTPPTPTEAAQPVVNEVCLQSYLDAANDVVFAIDTAGQIRYINAYGTQQLGQTYADLLGQSLLELIPWQFKLQAQQLVVRLLSKGQLRDQLLRLNTPSGQVLTLSVNASLLRQDQEITGAICTGRQVEAEAETAAAIETPPAVIETAAQISDDLFRAYVETANDVVYTLDLEGRFTFINTYGTKLFGGEEGDIIGKSYLEFVAPECHEATSRAFSNLLRTGELRDYEFTLLQKGSSRICVEVNGRLLYRDGQLIGGLGIGRDITERKRFEQQLQMFSKALDAANDSVVITDLKGKILYANLATQRILGRSPEALANQTAEVFYPNAAQSTWLIEQAQQGGWSGQVVCQRQDGKTFTALVSVGPVCNEDNEITAVSLIYRDITQLEQIKAELASKNLELERASRMKSEFLANMSHELRTPMTSILGFSSLLEQQIFGPLNERQHLYVQQIFQSGEHLLSLINEVLDLSKIEAGQMILHVAPISIESVCQNALNMISAQATAKSLTVEQDIQPNLPTLRGDELRIRQMLLNLLSNAVKFSEAGGAIGLIAKQVRGQIQLTVWDQGIGIPSEHQSLLFQPFQQLDSSLSRQHEGTGLGLALTYKLAKLHGGDVSVVSALHQGSRFTIYLPIEGLSEAQSRLQQINAGDRTVVGNPLAAPHPNRWAGEVLLVEDHPVNAMLLEHMLKYWGYKTHHVLNGQLALDWLQDHRPMLILMDIHLPKTDGIEITRQIRQNPDWKNIPIVAMTALVMAGDRDRCLTAGMQGYLSKPINSAELVSVLAKYTWQSSF